jgi:hypothetical protein
LDVVQDRFMRSRLISLQIGAYAASGDTNPLRKFMKPTPSLALLSPATLRQSLAAWRRLEMKQETALAEVRVKETFRKILENAWPERDMSGVTAALHFLLELQDKSLLPPALEADVAEWCAEPILRNEALFCMAAVREDWETCATRGLEEIRLQPANYPKKDADRPRMARI